MNHQFLTIGGTMTTSAPVHPAVRVGHVHLNVADLDRAIAFYRDGLGFGLVADGRSVGIPAAFLAAGDYHHHIGLNTFETAGATPPQPGHTGLYHVAFLYPDVRELARAVRRLANPGLSPQPRHGSRARLSVYLEDPDGNGVELYVDLARDMWRDENGKPILRADRVPIEQVTRVLEQAPD
jgi:catechol 2,3-dioxygenase